MREARQRRQRRFRTAGALAIVVIFVGVLVFRLVDIQVVRADALTQDALAKRGVSETIYASRGDIVDRNGQVLAETSMRYNVKTSPKDIAQTVDMTVDGKTQEVSRAQAFAAIGALTGQSADQLAAIVDSALAANPNSNFAYLAKSVDLAALNGLKALGIPWLYFEQNPDRVYPNGAVAGNLVGFMGDDGTPLGGLELADDSCLAPTDGEMSYQRSADNIEIPGSQVVTKPASDGGTLQLTIDRDLQWQAQQILQSKVDSTQSEWGAAVVLDAHTGKLLAVADNNTADPNDIDAGGVLGSRSFSSPYEPGSVFKTITASALIDQGLANPLSQAQVPYSITFPNGASFTDASYHGLMNYTLNGIITNSSNVGISILGQQLDPATRYAYLQKFGVGQPTGVDFPGESSGILADPSQWDPQTAYTTMFGQGLASTILQTAGVYQTIANGGVRVPMSLVESCTAADGTVTTPPQQPPVTVVKPDTAAQMSSMLESVVNEGWIAPYAQIDGYRIAGKTGTAQQSDGNGGYRPDYVYTFAGYFPADNPQYVAVLSLAFPKLSPSGSMTQTVIAFHDLAAATIKQFRVQPSQGQAEQIPTTW